MAGKHHAFVAGPGLARAVAAGRAATRRSPSWPVATCVGHGPAGDRDLAKWAGLPLRDARAGLGAIASELVGARRRPPRPRRSSAIAELPPPRLLGAFDPVLLGWTSREAILGPHTQLVSTNGLFRPFAMVDGRAVATWKLSSAEVTIEPLGRIPTRVAAALEADAAEVARFLAGPAQPRRRGGD